MHSVRPTRSLKFLHSDNYRINFDDLVKRQNELLGKISNVRIGKKTDNQKEVTNNLENFYISREEVINFFKDYGEMVLDAAYKSKQNETEGKGLKILTSTQILQRLIIQKIIQKGKNSESLLKEIRQNVYSLYQSKQITKKVYILKSI